MTDYTDLKARLRSQAGRWVDVKPRGIVWALDDLGILREALAAIEELERERDKLHMENETMRGFLGWNPEQRIQSMGGSSDGAGASGAFRVAEAGSLVRTSEVEPATSVKDTGVATSGEPPAQPIDGAGPVPALHQGSARSPDPATVAKEGAIPSAVAQSSAAPAPEPVAWRPLTDEDRRSALEAMPDWLDGFLKKWGWLNFAKEIERRCMEKNKAAPQPAQAEEEQ